MRRHHWAVFIAAHGIKRITLATAITDTAIAAAIVETSNAASALLPNALTALIAMGAHGFKSIVTALAHTTATQTFGHTTAIALVRAIALAAATHASLRVLWS